MLGTHVCGARVCGAGWGARGRSFGLLKPLVCLRGPALLPGRPSRGKLAVRHLSVGLGLRSVVRDPDMAHPSRWIGIAVESLMLGKTSEII